MLRIRSLYNSSGLVKSAGFSSSMSIFFSVCSFAIEKATFLKIIY